MTPAEVAERHRLTEHPYEGWFRQTDHAEGRFRSFLYLLPAGVFAPWHRVPADVLWSYEDGGPLAVSTSPDGMQVGAAKLGPGAGFARSSWVRQGAYQTLEPVGEWTLLRGTLVPDVTMADREVTPDAWYPGGGAWA
ncbi:cupin domain-containing protein [Parvularcula dongshanensis]|uniref:DUF985 domain-containing protein n=1 Tax=Parvularcula dongshanensis TaxID=1173995 RepID=A0A840I222_9PROT|nr:hypothetical protein [Parvularcula dongshanensis]